MHKRATSKRRAAEAEKETRMEEKEATSAEDVEEILTTVEDRQPEQVEEPVSYTHLKAIQYK